MRLLALLTLLTSACSIPVQGPAECPGQEPLAVSYSAPMVEPLYPLHVNPGPFDPTTVQAALDDWNRALGRVVLVLAPTGRTDVFLSEGELCRGSRRCGCGLRNRQSD